jgi:quinol monooxygenase YgiN
LCLPEFDGSIVGVDHVVTAVWTARPGNEDLVARAIDQLIEPSRAEPGNLAYHAHRSTENPRVFFFYERYADHLAYEAHVASQHFETIGRPAIELLESRERAFYEPLSD